ncbi:hypothetical protein IJR75_00205 [bacterium]|nr:hypothetical protein [bacterium]
MNKNQPTKINEKKLQIIVGKRKYQSRLIFVFLTNRIVVIAQPKKIKTFATKNK